MQDLRFYRPILRLIERGFSPYSKNIRAILILIIALVSIKHAGKKLLFLAVGALSLSLAVRRFVLEQGGLRNPYTLGIIALTVIILSIIAWFMVSRNLTHRLKLDYSFTAEKVLPFFNFLNIFIVYAIIGGKITMYSALAVFVSGVVIYYKGIFLKQMNYRGKEFIFWNLHHIPADKLLFPIEDADKLQKYKITLQDDTRNAIISPGDSSFFSKPIKVSGGDRLTFSIGLAEKVFSGDCRFEIYASSDRGHEEKIFSHHISPAAKTVDRAWKQFQVDLTPYNNKGLVLCFKTHLEGKRQRIEAYWEFPRIMHNKVMTPSLSSRKPEIENIIILVMDGVRSDLFQRLASIPEGIPNIDRFFSKNSMHFSQAITQNDWTVPAIVSMLSGRYAVSHQHFVSRPLSYHRPISSNLKWLPEILKEQGYLTYGFSDYCEINPAYGFARGFDSFYNGENLEEIDHGEEVSLHGLRFLRENEGQKKFLFLHYFSTHRPFKTRHPFRISKNPNFSNWFNAETIDSFKDTPYHKLNAEDKQAIIDSYSNSIAQTDRELSIIFDYLVARGEIDRSLVILTTDHGYPLFDRDSFSPKVTMLYDEIIRAPFLIRIPEGLLNIGPSKLIDSPIQANVDIFPTVLDVAGLDGGSSSDGQSLLKLAKGEAPFREHVISELYDTKSDTYMLSIRGERYKFMSSYNFDASRPFTFGTAKRREELLFDLSVDPCETKDISKEKKEVLWEYRKIEKEFSALHG